MVTNKACQGCQGKIQAHTSIQYIVYMYVCVILFFAMQCFARQGNAMQCKKPVAPPFTVTPAAERFRIHRGNRPRPNLRLQMGFPYVFRNPPNHKHFQPHQMERAGAHPSAAAFHWTVGETQGQRRKWNDQENL